MDNWNGSESLYFLNQQFACKQEQGSFFLLDTSGKGRGVTATRKKIRFRERGRARVQNKQIHIQTDPYTLHETSALASPKTNTYGSEKPIKKGSISNFPLRKRGKIIFFPSTATVTQDCKAV